MKNNSVMLPMRAIGLRKPEPITSQAEPIALPERRMNPLAVWKRNWVPEQDRVWVQVMKDLERKRRNA